MTRRLPIAAVLAVGAACAACGIERPSSAGNGDSAGGGAGGDSVATVRVDGIVVIPDSFAYRGVVVVADGAAAGPPPDTVTAYTPPPPRAPDSAAGRLAAPPAPRARGDTAPAAPAVATEAELRELARQLAIPVQGVRRDQLRDTYEEARGTRVHQAIDIHAPRGTPVLSATDGRVLRLHESRAGGLMVYAADASDRFILMYGHLDRYAPGLAPGTPLRRGQVIGYVGTTGNAPPNTPHLHFVVSRGRPRASWWRGTPVNPYPLLTGRAPERPR